MTQWADRRILDLFGIDVPIIQAPMAGHTTPEMVIEVSVAGGLGSLACAQYTVGQARGALDTIRAGTRRPINLNFFCHKIPPPDAARMQAWVKSLAPYYAEWHIDPATIVPVPGRAAFDGDFCALVEEYKPEIVSFHFGLPEQDLLNRVRATGAKIISSATHVAEARWLEERGCDAIIAMGWEAGGHRGNFLSDTMAQQVGTFALVPQIVDSVRVPVIAAGGIADARGIAAALMLGAAAVQIGTAYLFTSEAQLSALHRQALRDVADDGTAVTNLFTGRPARGIVNRLMREKGPLSPDVPAFPLASSALASLRAKSEAAGLADFTNLWAGQAAPLSRKGIPAGALTRRLALEALEKLASIKNP